MPSAGAASGGDAGEEHDVELYVYDITQGMARSMSPMLLGKLIEGVWHTSVVVGGREYFFGAGVQEAVPGTTPFGRPLRTLKLGRTQVPKDMIADMISDLKIKWKPEDYNLLFNNCNHFSNELAGLLCGGEVPQDILGQAAEVLNTPMGQMLMPMLLQMEGQMGGATAQGFTR